MAEWLTRDQIDEVIANLSADDVIEVLAAELPQVKVPMAIFNRAAERLALTNGNAASVQLKVSDMRYMSDAVGKALDLNSPKSDASPVSQDSAATGE